MDAASVAMCPASASNARLPDKYAADNLGNHEAGNQDEGDNQAAPTGFPQFGGVIVGMAVMVMP